MRRVDIITEIAELRRRLKAESRKTVGLVPTMGYLHSGHASLIERAREENDIVVVSVFVNPIQFGPNEDYDRYPRDLERDVEIIRDSGGDIVFTPAVEEMYPEEISAFVDMESEMTKKLCARSRSGHFRGVMTVVSKLFNIVNPDRSYFGQKDVQQVSIIEKMVRDLNFPIDVVRCPILRESDGLAMSSRNIYLTEIERKSATILYKSLELAKNLYNNGERRTEILRDAVIKNIENCNIADIEYVEVLDYNGLKDIDYIENRAIVAMAVRFGSTRLIDNCVLEGGGL